ncbi:site-specific integrase [Burkholderia sp. 9779_493]|uniref:site-specific integrase n=1 Tax=Burkholderia sp. 9779_493 TaxID=2751184 RepID=UPI0018C41102|nr:site-specific integrase [Burkholderia sp. 9779_493]MBG0863722.1 site-specific integrase [Burkholderia sp. 9779_493]
MATPTKLPRGIRLTTYNTKEGLVTKYRVEITRKDWQGKRNNLFDTLNEAKAFLLLSKNKQGQEFIYQTEEKTKNIEIMEWSKKDYSFGYFAKKYLEDYVFNEVADTELKKRNQAMKQAFINKICNISIPNRYITAQEKDEMGLEMDSIVYSYFSSFDVRTEIKPIDINNYIKTRLKGDKKNRAIKPVSVVRELTFISNVFNKLIHFDENLEVVRNPTRDYDKSLLRNVINVRKRTLKEEEEEKFFEVIKNYKSHKPKHRGQLYSICMLSLLTSMRKSEIVFLRKDQIKDDFRIIHLPITKSGKSRDVYLDETAREFLRNLEPMGENGRYFTYSNYGFSRVFTSLMRQNNLGDLHFHDLRRTKISKMLSLGGEENTIIIAKLLGFQSNRKFESIHVNKNQGLGSQSSMLASIGHDKEVNFKHYFNPDLTQINKLERVKLLKEKRSKNDITEEEQQELFDLLLQLTE